MQFYAEFIILYFSLKVNRLMLGRVFVPVDKTKGFHPVDKTKGHSQETRTVGNLACGEYTHACRL